MGVCSVVDHGAMNAEQVAQWFHENYEAMAPSFGWKTQDASRTSWDSLPLANRDLMIETVKAVFEKLKSEGIFLMEIRDPRVLDLRDKGYRLVKLEPAGQLTVGQHVTRWAYFIEDEK